VSSEGDERKEQTMTRLLFWWGVAVVVGWILLPASLESLSAAVGDVATELKVLPLPPGDVLKLVGGAALLATMWHWTTPESVRRSNSRRGPYRRK
jgi:hypothetical protein